MFRTLKKILSLGSENEEVHKAKDEFQGENLAIQYQAKKQVEESAKRWESIEKSKTYQIAVAQGGRKRGLD